MIVYAPILDIPEGCTVHWVYRSDTEGVWLTHMDNREASCFFPYGVVLQDTANRSFKLDKIKGLMQEWLNAVHAYEGGHDNAS